MLKPGYRVRFERLILFPVGLGLGKMALRRVCNDPVLVSTISITRESKIQLEVKLFFRSRDTHYFMFYDQFLCVLNQHTKLLLQSCYTDIFSFQGPANRMGNEGVQGCEHSV